MMDAIDKAFDRLLEIFDYVGRFFTVLICLIVAANAAGHTLFSTPIYGTYEYAQLGTVILLSCSIALCGLRGGHVYVTILTDLFPKWLERALIILWDILMGAISIFMSYYMYRQALSAFRTGDAINTIYISKGPFYILIALGFFLLGIASVFRIIRIVRHRDENTNKPIDKYRKKARSGSGSGDKKGAIES